MIVGIERQVSRTTPLGKEQAFRWTRELGIQPLAGFIGMSSAASGINDRGEIVGYVHEHDLPNMSSMLRQAAAWSPSGQIRMLPALHHNHASYAWDINEQGAIVGRSSIPAPGLRGVSAVLWTPAGAVYDLNTLIDGPQTDLHLTNATAINDFGQIVGEGRNAQNEIRAYLLTPVPEPATLAFAVAALVCFIVCRALR